MGQSIPSTHRHTERAMSYYKEAYRMANISYLRYCNICARTVRQSLKEPLRSDQILKTDLWRYSWMKFNKKNEMTTETLTNYEDQERLDLEEYVNKNKAILDPAAAEAMPGKK